MEPHLRPENSGKYGIDNKKNSTQIFGRVLLSRFSSSYSY